MWARLLSSTNQPSFMSNKEVEEEANELEEPQLQHWDATTPAAPNPSILDARSAQRIAEKQKVKSLWKVSVAEDHIYLPKIAPAHIAGVDIEGSGGAGIIKKINFTSGILDTEKNLLPVEPTFIVKYIHLQTSVVKHSVLVCSEARDLMEAGKARLAEGTLNEAYTLFSEAFSLLQQITGPMHRDVASCCRYLAMVLYHAGDLAGAIVQQHKELIINERCLGLDHPDTAHSYGNMALFYQGLNQTELALRHMSRTILLLSLSSGPDHPDVAATFINVAMMYQDAGNMNTALRYLQEALKKNERLLGPEHIQTAVCYHALAIAFNYMGAYKLSIQHEKKTYDILVKQLGEEDSRTRDSENWIKTFKLREQQVNAQKQKGQVVDSPSAQKAIDILKAHPDLVQAFQAAANPSASAVNRSLNAAVIGEGLPRGRGVDERAARAAAEARKKAVARGLLVRQNGVPVHALPPLTQLLHIINSSAVANGASAASQTNEPKGEATGNGPSPNGSTAGAKDTNTVEKREDQTQTPVGLGISLGSLDAKKQKSKAKAAA